MSNRFLCLLLTLGSIACAQQPDQTPTIQEPAEGNWLHNRLNPYRTREVSATPMGNSGRFSSLLRAGSLYLSLQDAIALALENNLDIEIQRFNIPIARTEVDRTKGGGLLRNVPLSISQPPAGVGSPATPLLNTAATGNTPTANLQTNVNDLVFLTQTQSSLSVVGANPLSSGPAIPPFDPSLTGQLSWQHQTTQQTNTLVTGTDSLVSRNLTGNLGYQQGFSPGTALNVAFNNANQNSNSSRTNYNPYTSSSLGFTVTQPLLRGFGTAVNRRFIRIAKNNEKVVDLIFRQQVIETVAGVIRLYYDLVSWSEDVRVKTETLALAQKLLSDNEDQVRQGTIAPIEITRARAQVAAAQQDLANSEGLRRQQELILKSYLTRRGNADPLVRSAHIITTDVIPDLVSDETITAPVEDYVSEASQNRPDLAQAQIQVENSEINLKGSRNAVLPQVDLFATAQNSGLAGSATSALTSGNSGAGGGVTGTPATGGTVLPTTEPTYGGGYGSALSQILRRNYPSYGVGVQLTLPLRNRVAIADLVRDELQVRQTQVRRQQLENQVRLEVEDALIALERTRTAYEAARQSRQLQEQSLASEQEKFAAGLSTSFLVIQYQSYLAQARSTEVGAKAAFIKARTALDRATGITLERNNVSFDEARKGVISRPPAAVPVVP